MPSIPSTSLSANNFKEEAQVDTYLHELSIVDSNLLPCLCPPPHPPPPPLVPRVHRTQQILRDQGCNPTNKPLFLCRHATRSTQKRRGINPVGSVLPSSFRLINIAFLFAIKKDETRFCIFLNRPRYGTSRPSPLSYSLLLLCLAYH